MDSRMLAILLVDDDEDDYVMTRGMLSEIEGATFSLEWAPTYAAGLEQIRRHCHDVYLLDYRLGEHDGLDLLRMARELGCDSPIILLTGQGDHEVDVQAMKHGVADYLIKGQIDAPLLERSIRHAMERAQALEALRESEARLEGILGSFKDGGWSMSPAFETLYLNPAVEAVYGRPTADFYADASLWLKVVHPEDRERVKSYKESLLAAGTHETEYRIVRPDGEVRWLYSRGRSAHDGSGAPIRVDGIATDITDRKRAEEQLLHDAFHDALTGLPNRALFMDRLGHAINRSHRRPDYTSTVLFLDLDRFKNVNDSLGHTVGDELLIAIARRLESCLRPGDTIARLGGDEFAILLDDVDGDSDVTLVVERIQAGLTLPFNLCGQEVFTTTSIGIASSATDYSRPEDLLRDADTAMYRAKASGKARHATFDKEMHAGAVALLRMEADLRRAVERGEFQLHYQPIVSPVTGKTTAVEALLRWYHPQRGLVSPAEFIPVAEETGLIVAIGEWVLRTACAQNAAWQAAGYPPVRVAVNFSARQFEHQGLPELIARVLRETGLDPRHLEIEVTESTAMKQVDFSIAILRQLSAMGVHIAIDDFGTGYSSLAYLQRLPVNTLKIDRTFVKDVTGFSGEGALTTAIINMAHGLNLKVTAEGVETEEQLQFLRSRACDDVQGFLLSRPLSAEVLSKRLLDGVALLKPESGSKLSFFRGRSQEQPDRPPRRLLAGFRR